MLNFTIQTFIDMLAREPEPEPEQYQVSPFAVNELWLLNRYSIKMILYAKLLHLMAVKINWFINEMQISPPFFFSLVMCT